MSPTTTFVIACIGIGFMVWVLLVILFAPAIPYRIEKPIDASSDHMVGVLEAACQTVLRPGNRIDILTNGSAFYPAMLEAIRDARETVNLECYIFTSGDIARQFTAALAERARAGVQVTIVLDTVGSVGSYLSSWKELKESGCRVHHYRPPTWHGLARLNKRTHRELLIVDGRIAFAGGAGVADWWWKPQGKKPAWRDMMARIEGPIVPALQGVFAENWLECCAEVLSGEDTYKQRIPAGDKAALVVRSSPSDRATLSRILFQTLIEGARKRVRISTPYFLPDHAFRRALARTVARGVEITVVVPGAVTDQPFLRLASRRTYGDVLQGGTRIFEFQPGMTHVKTLLVDDIWAVIGTTNLDNRSFEHNDEVNVAIRDTVTVARLNADFEDDISRSQEVTLEAWRRRSLLEKAVGSATWLLDRQQ